MSAEHNASRREARRKANPAFYVVRDFNARHKSVKMCSICFEVKKIDEFRVIKKPKSNNSLHHRSSCKSCDRIRASEIYNRNLKKSRSEARAKSVRTRPARIKNEVDSMHDNYVKRLISRGRIKHSDIPPALVELKRAQLQLHRKLHEATKA